MCTFVKGGTKFCYSIQFHLFSFQACKLVWLATQLYVEKHSSLKMIKTGPKKKKATDLNTGDPKLLSDFPCPINGRADHN